MKHATLFFPRFGPTSKLFSNRVRPTCRSYVDDMAQRVASHYTLPSENARLDLRCRRLGSVAAGRYAEQRPDAPCQPRQQRGNGHGMKQQTITPGTFHSIYPTTPHACLSARSSIVEARDKSPILSGPNGLLLKPNDTLTARKQVASPDFGSRQNPCVERSFQSRLPS